jgi:hypothetical protein
LINEGIPAGLGQANEIVDASRMRHDIGYLMHFNLSLPSMVYWIGSRRIAEHRDNEAIFARLKKTCKDKDYIIPLSFFMLARVVSV